MLVVALAGSDERLVPRSLTGHFLRPARSALELEVVSHRVGRTLTTTEVHARGDRGIVATASILSSHVTPDTPDSTVTRNPMPVSPPAPPAPPPECLDVFAIPVELVPVAEQTEIRPVGHDRPFAGGDTPELLAWIRLVEDDRPPDAARLTFLLDALAPAHAAVLTQPMAMPTVHLTMQLDGRLGTTDSPWVLLRARSSRASADGWLQEDIDAWAPDGTHLASARQLRLVTG
jgi:acyl-CoA thioesterase